jgi:DNA polymerase V
MFEKEVDMQASQPKPLALYEPLILPFAPEAVACGFPSPAEGYWSGDLDLIKHMVRDPASTFVWKAAGHSMTGAGINDGDLLLVDRGIDPVPGRIVVAIVDGEYTVKRLDVSQGRTVLVAENLEYADIVLHEHTEMSVWGVVTWILSRPKIRRGVRPLR